jgi:hypothetical protein
MLHRFNFVNLWESCYQGWQVFNNIFGGEAGPVPSEELVQTQALNVDLREAVMACLSKERVSPLDCLELLSSG